MPQTPKTFAQVALTRSWQTIYTAPTTVNSVPLIADLITDIVVSNNTRIDNPMQPTITNNGTAGTTSYTYYIVANDAWGGKTLVSQGGVTNTGNATLTSTNSNTITWTPVQGAVTYDILKGNLTTSLATAIQGTVSGNSLTFTDTGQATTGGYATPATNTTGIQTFVTIHHVPASGTLGLANRIAAFYEVDQGMLSDLQLNIPLAPGDTIQAKVNSSKNNDSAVDGNVTILLHGVEMS